MSGLTQLQDVVRRLPERFVVCHTDLIGDNLLVGADGRLSALDWDTAILAPPEMDLALLLHAEQPVDDHALRRVLGDLSSTTFRSSWTSSPSSCSGGTSRTTRRG